MGPPARDMMVSTSRSRGSSPVIMTGRRKSASMSPNQPQYASSSGTRPPHRQTSAPIPQSTSQQQQQQLGQRLMNMNPPAQVFTRGQFGSVKTRPAANNNSTTSSLEDLSLANSSRGSSTTGQQRGVQPQQRRSRSQDPKSRRRSSPNVVDGYTSSGGGRVRSRPSVRSAEHHHHHHGQSLPPQHHHHHQKYPKRSTISIDASSNAISSTASGEGDQHSVHSAPSVWRSSDNHHRPEWREPSTSSSSTRKSSSPIVIKPHSNNNNHHHHHHDSNTSSSMGSSPAANMRDLSPARSNSVKGEQQVDAQKHNIRTTKRVVDELVRAQGPRRRIEAITNACEVFDHYDEARHNMELLQGGAAQVLGKMLENPHSSDDTLRMICSALEMVFRASTRAVQQSYSKCGSGLLTNLLRLLDRCEKGDVKHAHISILNITRILLYLSKCPDLRYPLCRNSDLLDCFTRVLYTNQLTADCRALRIRILANLAAGDKNKVLLYEQVGLLDNVLRVANLDASDLARQHAATVLQELANCSFLHVSMAANDQLLGTLVKMALMEKSMQTRESAISALQTLAFTKENRVRLVQFKQGVVLEALRQAVSTDADDKVRRRAAGALTNLACEDTAKSMGNHKGLLGALAIVATKDTNVDVQTRASLALTKIGSSINVSMGDCFESLLDSLVVASLSTTSNSVTAVLRVKARESANRESMARHSCVLDTLADICVSPGAAIADRDNAMRTLMHLVNDSRNRIVMCNKIILDALVVGSNFEEPRLMEARESAIITLERLATEPSNRPRMARHPGLLVAVSKAVEREAKWEDARIESEHGYLAKPLLMSLLLAM